MKRRKKWKRVIGLIMTLLLIVTMIPFSSFPVLASPEDGTAIEENGEELVNSEETVIGENGNEIVNPEEPVAEEEQVPGDPVDEDGPEEPEQIDLDDGLYFGDPDTTEAGWPLITDRLTSKFFMNNKSSYALYFVLVEGGVVNPIPLENMGQISFKNLEGDDFSRTDTGLPGYSLNPYTARLDDSGTYGFVDGLFMFYAAFEGEETVVVSYGGYTAFICVSEPVYGLYNGDHERLADYAYFDNDASVFHVCENESFAYDPELNTSYKFRAKNANLVVTTYDYGVDVNEKVRVTPEDINDVDNQNFVIEVLDTESDYTFNAEMHYTKQTYVWNENDQDWTYEREEEVVQTFPFSWNTGYEPTPDVLEDGLYFGDVEWYEKPYANSGNLSNDRELGAKDNNSVSLYLVKDGEASLIQKALDNIRVVRRGTNTDAEEINLSYPSYGDPEENLVETDVFDIYSAVLGEYTLIYTDANNNTYSAYFTIALPNTGIYSAPEATLANLINGHEAEFAGSGQVFYLLTADQQSADGGYIRDVVFSKAPEVRIEGRDADYWDSICSIEPVGTDKKKYKVTILEDFEEIWIEADARETEKKKNDEGEYDVEVMDPWYQSYRFYPSESMNGVYVCDHIDWHDGIPEVAGEGNEWSRNRDWDAKIETNFGIKVIIDGEEEEVSTVDDFNKFSLVKAGSASLPAGTELRKMSYRYWDQKKNEDVEAYVEDMLTAYFTEEGIYYLIYNDGTNEVKAKINVKLPDFGIYSEPERNINTLIGRTDAIVNSENNVFFLIAADTVWGNSKRDCYYEGDPEISLMGRPEDYWDGVCRIGTYPSDDDNLQIYMVTVLDPTREFAVRAREVETYWDYDDQTGTWELRGDRSSWDTDYWFRPSADQGDGLYIGHMDWNEGIPYVQENENLEKFWEDSVKNSFSFALYLRKDGVDTLITTDQIDNITFGRKNDGSAASISALGYWDDKAQKDVLSEEIFDAVMNEPGLYELAYHDPETNYGYTVNFYASMPEFAVYSSNDVSLETLIAPRNVNYRIGENVFYLIATSENNETRNCFIDAEVIEGRAEITAIGVYEKEEGDETERVLVYKVTILDPTQGVRIRTTAERTNYRWEETESGAEFVIDGEPWTEEREFEFWRMDAQEGLLIGRAADGKDGAFVWQDNIHEYSKEWTLNALRSTIAASFAIADEDGNLAPISDEDMEYLTVTDMYGNETEDFQIVPFEYIVDYGDNNGETVIAEDVIGLIANRTGKYYITYSKDGFTDSVLVKAERQDIGLHNLPDDSEETLVSDRTGKFGCLKTFYIYAFEFENEYGGGITNEITSVRFANGWVPAEYWENRVVLAEEEEGKCWSVTILDDYRVPFEVEVEYDHSDYWDNNGTLETNEWHGGEWFRFEPEEPYDDYVYTIDDGELLQGFTATYIPEIVYQYPELLWSEYMGENVTMYYVHGETMEEVIEKLTAVEIGEKLIGVPVAGEDIDGIREATAEDNIVNTGYIEVYANQYGDREVVSQNIPVVENLYGMIIHTEDERYALKPDDTYYQAVTGKAPEISGGMYYIQDPKYMFDFFVAGYEDMNNQLERDDLSESDRIELNNKIAWLEEAIANLEPVVGNRDYGTIGDGVVGVDGKFYRAELNENSYENENGEWVTDHYFTLADKVVLFELDQEGISAFESYEFELLREDRDEGMNHPMPYRRLSGIDGINLHISTDVKFSGNLGGLTIIYPDDMENVPNVEFFENTYVAGTGTRNEETGEWTVEPEWINVIDWDSYPDGVLVESDEWWGTYQLITKKESKVPEVYLNLEGDGVVITWDAIEGISKYRVLRKEADGNFVALAKVSATTYIDKNVEPGKTYTYTVRCMDGTSYVGEYDQVGKSIEIPYIPMVKDLTVAIDGNTVVLNWSAVEGAEKYRVMRKEGLDTYVSLAKITATTYVDKNAEPGKTYTYTVRCMDATSYIGDYDKNGKSIAVPKEEATPMVSDLTLTLSGNTVVLNWSAVEGAEKYRVMRKEGLDTYVSLAKIAATTYVDKNVEPGKTYTYTVRCMDAASYIGDYDKTGKSIAVPKEEATPMVSDLTLAIDGNTVVLNWTAVEGAGKYRVMRKDDSGKFVAIAKVTAAKYIDKNVEIGKTYTYTVRCMDDSGAYIGEYDKTGTSIEVRDRIYEPDVSVESVSDGVAIRWNSVDGAVKYRVMKQLPNGTFEALAKVSGTTYTDKTAVKGETYTYTVRCMDAEGKYFGDYNTVGVTITY